MRTRVRRHPWIQYVNAHATNTPQAHRSHAASIINQSINSNRTLLRNIRLILHQQPLYRRNNFNRLYIYIYNISLNIKSDTDPNIQQKQQQKPPQPPTSPPLEHIYTNKKEEACTYCVCDTAKAIPTNWTRT